MKIKLSEKAIRQYLSLPKLIQKKAGKQFAYLLENHQHPSLNIKKYRGFEDLWQGRIDKGYRFYFYIIDPDYIIISIIKHPK